MKLRENMETHRGKIPAITSFLLPVLAWSLILIARGMHPFGTRQIPVIDGWHQYFPFLSEYWTKLREGPALTWSWTGGGGDYLGQISYYLASPFNLIIALFPHEHYIDVITWLIPLKMGMAGYFMCRYLRQVTEKVDNSLPIFSMLYATCAWIAGYYWNIMWIDTFAFFPLVMQGTYQVVKENRVMTYIIALAWSILSNFYIALYTCIGVVIMFIVHWIMIKPSAKSTIFKIIRMILSTLIAIGTVAFLILPAFMAMQSTFRASGDVFPTGLLFYSSFFDIIGSFAALMPAAVMDGGYNLYTGLLTILLCGAFLASKQILLREKITYFGLLVFMVLSFNTNILTYIWNGFHYTNGMWARFSFINSFLLCYIGYKTYLGIKENATGAIIETDKPQRVKGDRKIAELVLMVIMAIIVVGCMFPGIQDNSHILQNIILAGTYITLIAVTFIIKKKKVKQVINLIIMLLLMGEALVTLNNGVQEVGYSDRDIYPAKNQEVQQLLSLRDPTRPELYRTEMIHEYNCNSNAIYGYEGIISFSSTLDARIGSYLRSLGMPADAGSNRYYYRETSPLTNMFLNIRYGISLEQAVPGMDINWQLIAEYGEAYLLESNRYLPLGFIVKEEMLEFKANAENPFLTQNQLFSLSTGIMQDLYSLTDTNSGSHKGYAVAREDIGRYHYTRKDGVDTGGIKWNYTIPDDGYYYIMSAIDQTKSIEISSAGVSRTLFTAHPYWHIAPMNYYKKGQVVTVSSTVDAESGYAVIYVARLNEELLEEGYQVLAQEQWQLTEGAEEKIKGTIETRGGLLYTSIPYNRNWKAYINGEEADIELIGNCMMALRLPPGKHEVEFRYRNISFIIGIIVSIISLIIITILYPSIRRHNKLVRQKEQEQIVKETP